MMGYNEHNCQSIILITAEAVMALICARLKIAVINSLCKKADPYLRNAAPSVMSQDCNFLHHCQNTGQN